MGRLFRSLNRFKVKSIRGCKFFNRYFIKGIITEQKLDRVGPVDDGTSTNYLYQFERKEKNNYMQQVTGGEHCVKNSGP